jgi:transposase InsO family protein
VQRAPVGETRSPIAAWAVALVGSNRALADSQSGHLALAGRAARDVAGRRLGRTQIGSPQTNGFCERFHRTIKEEFFAVAFRKIQYESVDQLQGDLDRYLDFYNRERAHQGYRTKGRTPYKTFLDGIAAMQEQEVNPEAA